MLGLGGCVADKASTGSEFSASEEAGDTAGCVSSHSNGTTDQTSLLRIYPPSLSRDDSATSSTYLYIARVRFIGIKWSESSFLRRSENLASFV